MVPLLHHHEGDARLVVLLQLDAGLADGQQLMLQHLDPQQVGEKEQTRSVPVSHVETSYFFVGGRGRVLISVATPGWS